MNSTHDVDAIQETTGRKRVKSTLSEPEKAIGRCLVGSLPVELLHIILSSTTPRDILALARTNKYFCATLVNPAHAGIWKKARSQFPLTIPEPTPNFTEPAYAAFLFDHGVCEECGKKVKLMYASFAIRLRLCDKDPCRDRWKASKGTSLVRGSELFYQDRYNSILEWAPSLEYNNFGFPSNGVGSMTHPVSLEIIMRKVDLEEYTNEYNKAAFDEDDMKEYAKQKTALVLQNKSWMKLCKALVVWRNMCTAYARKVAAANFALAKVVAIQEGWVLWDMLQSRTFGSLYRSKNTSWLKVDHDDLVSIQPELEAELLQMKETLKRRMDEKEYSKRRKDVESFYHSVKGEDDAGVLPPLSEFRKLPMVQRMQYKIGHDPSKGVAKELKSSQLVRELVKEDLSRWRDEVKVSLGAILGFKGWKSASTNKLHPVDRLTARFRCKRCDNKPGHRQRGEPSFDYAGACGHVCTGNNGRLAKDGWTADRFVPDSKAIDVVAQVLRECGSNTEDGKAIETVKKLGSRIICTSCPARLRMDFRTLLHHCHRHEDPAIEVLPEDQVDATVPIEYGLRAKLQQKEAEIERRRRVYHCRHCIAARTPSERESSETRAGTSKVGPDTAPRDSDVEDANHVGEAATTASTSPSTERASRVKKHYRVLTFDGLRSHAKEKHGIEWIGDEDFFREPTPAPAAATETA